MSGTEEVLERLRRVGVFDFAGYRRSNLTRLVIARMRSLGVADHDAYLDRLDADPMEARSLACVLCNTTTAFFRDRLAWSVFEEAVVPEIVARKPDGPIRVWNPGCGDGREPYSIAMVFADAMGMERARRCVSILATDIDDRLLARAREASYPRAQAESVSAARRARYLDRIDGRVDVVAPLRSMVALAVHDLRTEVPVTDVDLVVCRYVVMHLVAAEQRAAADRFRSCLHDAGWLWAGDAEMPLAFQGRFDLVQRSGPFFRRLP